MNSDNGSVIATAAHCVWDFDANAPLREILFVPGDRGNAQTSPWGIWAVDRVWVPDEFTDTAVVDSDGRTMGEGWAYDYAFATIAPNSSGEVIQSYTGGQGISFAQQYAGIVTVGYPSDPPYDGQSPQVLRHRIPRLRNDVLAAHHHSLRHDRRLVRIGLADRCELSIRCRLPDSRNIDRKLIFRGRASVDALRSTLRSHRPRTVPSRGGSMKKLTRSLRALAIATVAATALSGCVFVPALLQGPPVQDPDQSPTQHWLHAPADPDHDAVC